MSRPAPHVRRGGHGRTAGGGVVTWSVAAGARGRRWRAAVGGPDGSLVRTILLELAGDGRPARLEVGERGGLLTLHPEPDGRSLHGNTVTPGGIEHHTLAWSSDHVLLVAGDPVSAGAACRGLAAAIGVGEGRDVPTVLVGPGPRVTALAARVERVGEAAWRVTAAGHRLDLSIDGDGLPTGLGDAAAWPLERDGDG